MFPAAAVSPSQTAGASGIMGTGGGGGLEQARKKDHKFSITEIAIRQVPLIETPMLSEIQSKSLHSMHQELLRIAARENGGNEVALVATDRFAKPYIKVYGTENSVRYADSIEVNVLKRDSY